MKKRINGLGPGTIGWSAVTVGADPEFELVSPNGRIVRAGHRLSNVGGTGQNVEIGVDGAGSQIEFRPAAATFPIGIVTKFKSLLERFSTQHPRHSLSWAGNHYPLGGHIHVGNSQLHDALDMNRSARERLCEVLDDFIEAKVRSLNGGARYQYAGRGHIRMQDWGIEYRGCAAGVFASPAMTRVTIRLVKGLVINFMNKRRLVYENPPLLADYMRLGNMNASDCALFLSEAERLAEIRRTGSCDMLAAWAVRVPPSAATLARRAVAAAARREAAAATLAQAAAHHAAEREAHRIATSINPHAVTLHTSDEWNDSVAGHLRRWAETLYAEVPVNLTLYGLAAPRGEVVSNNLALEGYETIVHSPSHSNLSDGNLHIGLAHSLRTTYDAALLGRLKDALLVRLAYTAWGVRLRVVATQTSEEAANEEIANIADSGMPLAGGAR
jgi:hypothetical protein